MNSSSKFSLVLTELKQSLHIAFPLIVTYVVQASSAFVATLMMARLGKFELATVSLVWTLYLTVTVLFAGVFSPVSVLIAQQRGAKQEEDIPIIISQSFVLSLLLSIPLMILFWAAPFILRWSGQNPQVVRLATEMLYALSWSIFPLACSIVMTQFLIGLEKTRLVLLINILQVPCEIVVNYVLVFGKFGFPKLGVSGLGYGFTTIFILVATVLAISISYSSLGKRYRIFSHLWVLNKKYLFELMRVGLPIGGMLAIEVGYGLAVAFLMGRIGVDVLAAHQIAMQYWNLSINVYFGFSEATAIRVGYEAGANNRVGMQRAYFVNLGLGLFYVLIVGFFFFFFPEHLIAVDINPQLPKYVVVVHWAEIFLAICAFYQFFDSSRWIAIGALRGLKDTTFPMLVSGIIFWFIGLPFGYWLVRVTHLGGAGLWWGTFIGGVIGLFILTRRFYHTEKRIDLAKLVS
ncbi:MAG: MATE family efflux transporter [Pseudomonadota bacterium]|nr:MATE family efflux transporter [Gammaproteobacteria bacterium]MBU1558353.1 MATE family efflux transporter [Gammaproteobacteria bacterium]MBU1628856.1 MATE family efflux transporter [Gammaproteobacteria bacterium]MBU1927201.1 MATE family efflux transporter [Gammaproteobacteria bacterium]MBU2546299.1 MATE family efflux transporter [Gammaproteobacteria bacterium]